MLSYYVVPVWFNYSSNLANGHSPGLSSKCATDRRVGVGGRFCFFYYTRPWEARGIMPGLRVGVVLFKATFIYNKSKVELIMTNEVTYYFNS